MTLDTREFDKFIEIKPKLISKYEALSEKYDEIISTLLNSWKGEGAEAFKEDARKVKSNIVGIQDILQTMCNTLVDSRDIFGECDTSLGEANRNAMS
ncbi:MAG: hypothetical protein LBT59_14825 [Clostridiales bacterium]|jgi:uncharacterized protein YukE|nr:hypothetical protein [Clostridiales bacterium]